MSDTQSFDQGHDVRVVIVKYMLFAGIKEHCSKPMELYRRFQPGVSSGLPADSLMVPLIVCPDGRETWMYQLS